MSLRSHRIYDSFVFSESTDPNNSLWILHGPLSSDLVAGLLIAFVIIISKVQLPIAYRIEIVRRDEILTFDTLFPHSFDDMRKEYLVYDNIPESELTRYIIPSGYYGWWIEDFSQRSQPVNLMPALNLPGGLSPLGPISNPKMYTLYKFKTPEFTQGFISMFNSINLDFRDYIRGPPFSIDRQTNRMIPYNIEGYDIEPFAEPKRVTAPVGAFYTGSFEADATGEDYN